MILAGTPDGVYRTPEAPFAAADRILGGVSVRALHARDGAVFAATDSGLFRTTDGGDSWTDLQLPEGNVHAVGSSDRAILAGVEPAGLHRSPDGGGTWTGMAGFAAFAADAGWPTNPHHDHACVRSVASPEGHPDTLLVSVEVGGFVASTDGGESWRTFDAVPDDVHHVLPASAERWIVSCGVGGPDRRGGVFETTDAGETWVERDVGEYDYVRESCYDGRLYAAGNRDPPFWTPPDAAILVDGDEGLAPVSYTGEPERFVISWAVSGEGLLAGANDGSILRGPDDWERLGTVPVSEEDRKAWGVRSLAVIDG